MLKFHIIAHMCKKFKKHLNFTDFIFFFLNRVWKKVLKPANLMQRGLSCQVILLGTQSIQSSKLRLFPQPKGTPSMRSSCRRHLGAGKSHTLSLEGVGGTLSSGTRWSLLCVVSFSLRTQHCCLPTWGQSCLYLGMYWHPLLKFLGHL